LSIHREGPTRATSVTTSTVSSPAPSPTTSTCLRGCGSSCPRDPPGQRRSRRVSCRARTSAQLRGVASGRVLVVASPQRDPVLIRHGAPGRTDLGELLEVFLTGRAGREQDEHPGWRTALVGEGVNPALRNVEEITLHRVDPGFPVEEPDGALHDVEGLGKGLVK